MSGTLPNRHPADRLGEARRINEQCKLEIESARQEILRNPRDLEGDDYIVNIERREAIVADKDALIRDFGPNNKYLKRRTITYVYSNKI